MCSGFKGDHDKGQDKSLERTQTSVAFGKKWPKFEDLQSTEEEKEEGKIQEPPELNAVIISRKDFPAYREANMEKYLTAKAKQHIRAFTMEIVRKSIQRDPKGKAFGTGSF